MTAKMSDKPRGKSEPKTPTVSLTQGADETAQEALAKGLIEPALRHGHLAHLFTSSLLKGTAEADRPDLTDFLVLVARERKAAAQGDLAGARRMLATHALTLDGIFTEMARRAALNMGEYIQASETYMRLALKAQAQCRATVQALDRLTNGHVQTVKHVHVNEGGQAVIADQVHNHAGGQRNEKLDDQSQGTGTAGISAALPCPDPLGNGVPIPSREGEAALQDARRHEPRRA